MKRSRIVFFVLIAVFFVAVFLVQYNTPRPFIWKPTYLHDDRQPFGCYVFDDVLASSFDDYRVEQKSLYKVRMEYPDTGILPRSERRTYLLIQDVYSPPDSGLLDIRSLLRQGHNVVICASDFSEEMMETFGFSVEYNERDLINVFDQAVRLDPVRDTIYYGTCIDDDYHLYRVFPQLHPVYLELQECELDRNMAFLARDNHDQPLALIMSLYPDDAEDDMDAESRWDYGSLLIVSTPLLFTNYGILDGDNASYIFRLLYFPDNYPIVRLEESHSAASPSLLKAIFDSPALKAAFYSLLLLVLLLMANAAQRKQRPIPVVTPPVNEMLRFTRLIGNLFYQKRDYQDLLRKKYLYFRTELRRRYATDPETEPDPKAAAERLAARTGLPVEEVTADFVRLKHLLSDGTRVSEADMRRAIDGINHWKRKLK